MNIRQLRFFLQIAELGSMTRAASFLHVLVTGGGRGIGRACALSCASSGARVIAVARTKNDLEMLRAESGGAIETWTHNVTEPDFWRALERRRDIDVLINNAGTNRLQNLTDVDDDTLDVLLTLNVRAAFKTSQAVAKSMLTRSRGGSIIHISSQMGHVGAPKRSVYCMTKHAIEGLTEAMAIELAPHGIRVNAVAPTIVETSMTAPFLGDASYRQFAMDTIPLKRIAEPCDVAGGGRLSGVASCATGDGHEP